MWIDEVIKQLEKAVELAPGLYDVIVNDSLVCLLFGGMRCESFYFVQGGHNAEAYT